MNEMFIETPLVHMVTTKNVHRNYQIFLGETKGGLLQNQHWLKTTALDGYKLTSEVDVAS
jgi:hypothetical protein